MFNASNFLVRAMEYKIPSGHKFKKTKIFINSIKKKTNYYLTDVDYYWNVYLKSDHWKKLREDKLKANPICECCSTLSNLDIHHINYKSLYNVDLSDLKTLCRKCHNEEHKNINKHKVTFPKKQFRLTLRCCKETSGYNILFNIFNSLTPNVYLIKWILNNLNEQLIIPSGRRGISKANKRRINGE